MQVFYVNIGGGGADGPAPDFWEAGRTTPPPITFGVKFSTNGVQDHPGGGPAAWPPATTSTCRSRWTARRPRVNDAVPRGPAPYATALRAMDYLAQAGFRGFQDLGSW